MNNLRERFGIVTALNTPFTDADAIDLAGLRRNVPRAEAQTLFRELLLVLDGSNQHLDISIHCFKCLFHAQALTYRLC